MSTDPKKYKYTIRELIDLIRSGKWLEVQS